ncbi:MAG: metal ABC transporter ATP-binding protein [Chloroflexi bacterium]|nr:metal ABC transporter ATP-binding protein [Chloroflexota bacterium]
MSSQASGAEKETALEVKGLWVGYDKHPALEDVSFSVRAGEMVGVVGPNGAGKSTLFKVILGLRRAWRGTIQVAGMEAKSGRHLLGYMPQMELVDWQFPVTVFDVVMMGRYGRLGLFHRPMRKDRDAVLSCLEQVGMQDLAGRQIGELSGGQQRRAFIARALAQEPEVLLLDEPMAGLDAAAQHDFLVLLDTLRQQDKTILVATHDLSCVATSFDKALCLNRRVIALGSPRDVLTMEILYATYQSHLLLVNVEGKIYASHK